MIKITDVQSLGHVARRVRKSQEIDQETAGYFAGAGLTFVSQFENGKETVQLGKVLSLLASLGVDIYVDVPSTAGNDSPTPPAPSGTRL